MKFTEAEGGREAEYAVEERRGETTAPADGRVLEDYIKRTAYLGWIEASSPPLDHESVIAVFEENGAVRFTRTRYLRAAGGWTDRTLRNRRFWWVHDPPV